MASPAPPLIRNPINYGRMQVEAGRWWTNQQLVLTSLSAPATGTINHTPNCRSLGSGPAPTSAPAAGSASASRPEKRPLISPSFSQQKRPLIACECSRNRITPRRLTPNRRFLELAGGRRRRGRERPSEHARVRETTK
jgi:hypothetical protein